MKIQHLSSEDSRGGAARAAYRLHSGLRRLGHDSRMFVLGRHSDDPSVVALTPPRDPLSRLRRHLRRTRIGREAAAYARSRPEGFDWFSDDRSIYGATLMAQLPPGDVLTLHWVAGLLDYESFFASVPARVPVVWRLADMNPLTGGCHYDNGCGRYASGCGACPQLGSRQEEDLSSRIWRRKREAYRQIPPGRLHIVALNRWMADEVRRSPLLGACPVTIIPNGLDTEAYAPRDKAAARAVIGIPQQAKVVLFAAHAIGNRRKGFALLAEALAGVEGSDDLVLVSLGGGKPAVPAGCRHIHLGLVTQDRLLSMIYSAADLFISPALQDNLPNTVIESLACGTPVIGFGVGGVPDLVRHGENGLLVEAGDVAGLRRAIGGLLEDEGRRGAMAGRCRAGVLAEHAWDVQVRRYVALYESLAPQLTQSAPIIRKEQSLGA
jgi:glycosyltransferase involved in cell wall biosynthesis